MTVAEIGRGVAQLPAGRKRNLIAAWLDNDLAVRFEDRILDIDAEVARRWGGLMTLASQKGASMQSMDGLIAATATVHDLVVVTRNVRDFRGSGIQLLNPWST